MSGENPAIVAEVPLVVLEAVEEVPGVHKHIPVGQLMLVMADHFMLLYAGWELVGLCSYLLISFWFEKPVAAAAGRIPDVTKSDPASRLQILCVHACCSLVACLLL